MENSDFLSRPQPLVSHESHPADFHTARFSTVPSFDNFVWRISWAAGWPEVKTRRSPLACQTCGRSASRYRLLKNVYPVIAFTLHMINCRGAPEIRYFFCLSGTSIQLVSNMTAGYEIRNMNNPFILKVQKILQLKTLFCIFLRGRAKDV